MAGMHDGGYYAGRCWCGHADKILRASRCHTLHVEARQAPGRANQKGKAADPGKVAKLFVAFAGKAGNAAKAPGVGKDRGSDSEGDDVG